jgi:hypothetical protein
MISAVFWLIAVFLVLRLAQTLRDRCDHELDKDAP